MYLSRDLRSMGCLTAPAIVATLCLLSDVQALMNAPFRQLLFLSRN
jgi:hypothetical protein